MKKARAEVTAVYTSEDGTVYDSTDAGGLKAMATIRFSRARCNVQDRWRVMGAHRGSNQRTKSMRNVLKMAFALLLVWHAPVLAQTWRPIDNPEKFVADVVQTIANGASNAAAMTLIEAIRQPSALSALQGALRVFDDKKFDFSKKVIDNEIRRALSDHPLFICRASWIYLLPVQLQNDQ
jgi:hypothetical protein